MGSPEFDERRNDPIDPLDWAGRGRGFRAPPPGLDVQDEIDRLMSLVPKLDEITTILKSSNDEAGV